MAEHNGRVVTVSTNIDVQSVSEARTEGQGEETIDKVHVPMTIAESTPDIVPRHLKDVIEQLVKRGGCNKNKFDLFYTLCISLMVESGFVPKFTLDSCDIDSVEFHKDRVRNFTTLQETWRSENPGSTFADFVLQPFPNYSCRIVCISILWNVNLNISINNVLQRVISFNHSKYICNEKASKISLKFCSLNDLEIEFKDKVSNYAKMTILEQEGVPFPCLRHMPSDILYQIFLFLNGIDFVNLCSTCVRMQSERQVHEDRLWRIYFQREFPKTTLKMKTEENPDWQAKYVESFMSICKKNNIHTSMQYCQFGSAKPNR